MPRPAHAALERAGEVIVIGDGAPWIWNLAAEHVPGATQICDLYHSREHLNDLAKQVLAMGGIEDGRTRVTARHDELDRGAIDDLLLALLETPAAKAKEEVRKAVASFDTTASGCATDGSALPACSLVRV